MKFGGGIFSKKNIFILFAVLFAGALVLLLFIWHCNRVIGSCGERCYADIDSVPARDVGLLLGTAKESASGVPNLYFLNRVEAAAKLYHAGKVRYILISGDNGRKGYDEPSDMKEALMQKGVPESVVTLDYAGFRTLDSVVRAKAVFDCSKITVISQGFHAERAIYIASKHGVDAIGFAAEDPAIPWLRKRNHSREKLARVAAWLDVNILKRKPRFYGEKIPVILQDKPDKERK